MKWEKAATVIASNGAKTITYVSGRYNIISHKRPIPHANGIGFWMYTDYTLIRPDGTEQVFQRFADAREAAEEEMG
jgi:hypothetical protein